MHSLNNVSDLCFKPVVALPSAIILLGHLISMSAMLEAMLEAILKHAGLAVNCNTI